MVYKIVMGKINQYEIFNSLQKGNREKLSWEGSINLILDRFCLKDGELLDNEFHRTVRSNNNGFLRQSLCHTIESLSIRSLRDTNGD